MSFYVLPIVAVFITLLTSRPWRSAVIVVSLLFALLAEDFCRRRLRR